MAIGIVDNSDFERELNRLNIKEIEVNNDIENNNDDDNELIINDNKPLGRGIGNTEVDLKVKQFVAELAIEGYSNSELKDITKLSQSSISAYKNGADSTSSYNKPNPAIESHIVKVKNNISKKARKVALISLNSLLEPGRIASAKTRDIASIARTASAIIKDMEVDPKSNPNQLINNGVQFIMMSPPIKQENVFDAIDVSALDE